jgi:hypothetical protein
MDKKQALKEFITQDLILYTADDNNIPIEIAMDKVYNSTVFEKLSDDETGLYLESSSYIYTILQDEFSDGKIIQKEF